MTEKTLREALEHAIDRIENLLGALLLPLPPHIHLQGLRGNLPEIRDEMRDALERFPESVRALAAPPALAAAPGGAEIELTPAGREARDDPAEREAQGNFVSGPWCDATPPDEAHPKCTRRPGHEGDHVAARARHWEGEIRRPRLILARWPSAPAPSVAPGHEPEVKE
jgi:hypothetical protein